MAWTHVRHRIEDYPRWKEVFDSTAEYKRSHGWKGYRLLSIEGDNNHLLVMEKFETEDQVPEFLGSEYLREAMGRAGVSEVPDILVVELLEESTDRLGPAQQAAQTAQEGMSTVGQTTGGLLGAAAGAVTDVTGAPLGPRLKAPSRRWRP